MIEVKIGSAPSYTASGVDIDAGGKISQLWQEAARQTYNNRDDRFGQLAIEGNRFSDVRGIDLDAIQGKSGLILHGGVDGVGTKPELAERGDNRRTFIDSREERRNHGGIFEDLTAMVADDIARDGGEPVAIWTLFDASELTSIQAEDVAWQLGLGAVEACGKAKIVFSGGETAELGNRVSGYGPFNYNLGGFAIGVSHCSRVLTGEKVLPGDSIVALQEDGFRANGMSLVREVLAAEFGESWHLENEDLARQALQPSKIYTPALVDMHGGYDLDREAQAELSAIVHVTGSGIPGKLQRKLAITGYGAVLEDLFDPQRL
jgi:phosphoribosylformylglycinamidine cyclo-ligase